MSWVKDTLDDLVLALRDDGSVRDLAQETSIKKGLEEDFFSEIAQNQFPIVRVVWGGTEEEDEPADDYPERMITLNVQIHLAVYDIDAEKRLDKLTELEERVKNAIYRREQNMGPLVLDSINISSTEVAADLFPPFGLAVMTVQLISYTARDARTGR